jgi:hypothetical protein
MFKLKFKPSGKFISILLILVLIGLWFYWFEWRQEIFKKKAYEIKSTCEKKIFNRSNELNYEWAEGKEWRPLPSEVQSYEYGWIYPDQQFNLRTKTKITSFAGCLKENRIELYVKELYVKP